MYIHVHAYIHRGDEGIREKGFSIEIATTAHANGLIAHFTQFCIYSHRNNFCASLLTKTAEGYHSYHQRDLHLVCFSFVKSATGSNSYIYTSLSVYL